MKAFQIRNIAACWKVSEEEVKAVIDKNGGIDKASFKKVDGFFKQQAWEKRKVEFRKNNAVTIKFSDKKFFVGKGFYQKLKRIFECDDIYLPDGWDQSLSINYKMVSFNMARIFDSKTCDPRQKYMYVKIHRTRQEMIAGKGDPADNQIYIIPYILMTNPVFENDVDKLNFETYVKENACTTFSQSQLEEWRKKKKLEITCGDV